MRKFIFTITTLLTIGFTAHSQEINYGIKAGLNLADFGKDAEHTNVKPGFTAGVLAEIKFTENFAVQPEIVYSQQGSELVYNIFFGDKLGTKDVYTAKIGYINIPITVKYYIIEGLSIQAGPQIGFLVSAKDKAKHSNYYDDTENETLELDSKDLYKKIDFSIVGGIGYDLPIGLFLQARYSYGLTDINDDPEADGVKISNNVISFSVGYKF